MTGLTQYELDRIERIRVNDAYYKSLGLPSRGPLIAGVQDEKTEGKDSAECDEYIPEETGSDDNDDSSEVHENYPN